MLIIYDRDNVMRIDNLQHLIICETDYFLSLMIVPTSLRSKFNCLNSVLVEIYTTL